MKKFFVVVPVYNEQKHIKSFITKLRKFTKNIIVVNDGSTDKTKEILTDLKKTYTINLKKNQGKGAAMRYGAKLAWKLKADGIVFMDGDNQHNPKYLKSFFKLLRKNHHIVIGIRVLKTDVPLFRKFGNKLLINLVRILFGVYLEDLICGFRGFSKIGYKQILWTSNRYEVETEMITIMGRKKLAFQTLVVDTIYLEKYKGFSIKDGLKIVAKLPFWRLKPFI